MCCRGVLQILLELLDVLFQHLGRVADALSESHTVHTDAARSISEISSCFFGPRPWHIEIRHRVKRTSTINLFGFETLKLKIRRLKLWKPTAAAAVVGLTNHGGSMAHTTNPMIAATAPAGVGTAAASRADLVAGAGILSDSFSMHRTRRFARPPRRLWRRTARANARAYSYIYIYIYIHV